MTAFWPGRKALKKQLFTSIWAQLCGCCGQLTSEYHDNRNDHDYSNQAALRQGTKAPCILARGASRTVCGIAGIGLYGAEEGSRRSRYHGCIGLSLYGLTSFLGVAYGQQRRPKERR